MSDEKIIICRCEDITLAEIKSAIEDGYSDFEELKRYLRVGMGPCGGRTCIPLIRRILAGYNHLGVGEIEPPTERPPTQVITFGAIADGRESE